MGNNITKIKNQNIYISNNDKDYINNINENNEYNDNLINQHFILKNLLYGNLHLKNDVIDNITLEKERINILDLGCGTGVWCFDLMEEIKDGINNNIYIYGTDIKKRYPYEIKPKNIDFGIMSTLDNIENTNLDFIKKDNFDLIYQRLMFSTFKNNEWDIVINNIYRLLKKEGWFEIVDTDYIIKYDIINPSKNVENMNKRWKLFFKSYDININLISNLDNILLKKDLNVSNIEKKRIKVPIGNIHNKVANQFSDIWCIMMLRYIDKLKYKYETYDDFRYIVDNYKKDLSNSDDYYIYFYIYTGKKIK